MPTFLKHAWRPQQPRRVRSRLLGLLALGLLAAPSQAQQTIEAQQAIECRTLAITDGDKPTRVYSAEIFERNGSEILAVVDIPGKNPLDIATHFYRLDDGSATQVSADKTGTLAKGGISDGTYLQFVGLPYPEELRWFSSQSPESFTTEQATSLDSIGEFGLVNIRDVKISGERALMYGALAKSSDGRLYEWGYMQVLLGSPNGIEPSLQHFFPLSDDDFRALGSSYTAILNDRYGFYLEIDGDTKLYQIDLLVPGNIRMVDGFFGESRLAPNFIRADYGGDLVGMYQEAASWTEFPMGLFSIGEGLAVPYRSRLGSWEIKQLQISAHAEIISERKLALTKDSGPVDAPHLRFVPSSIHRDQFFVLEQGELISSETGFRQDTSGLLRCTLP